MRLTTFSLIAVFVLSFAFIVPAVVSGSPVYYPVNGHYYDVIPVQSLITWFEARAASQSLSYQGLNGHLATITSRGENDVIKTGLSGDYWIGGYQPEGSEEPAGSLAMDY